MPESRASVIPALYKYLDVDGAKKTLANKSFRCSKPSTFEDLEDMTLGSIFVEDIETSLLKISERSVDVITENVDAEPTCAPKLAAAVKELQRIFRDDPGAAEAVRDKIKKTGIFNVQQMRVMSDAFVSATNSFMQTYRIFCVSLDKTSERMWEDHAQDHMGIAIRIEPNLEKDSVFKLFRPVEYHRSRPALYDQPQDFLKEGLFADQAARPRTVLDKIIYAKTLRYRFEKEYRLAIPFGQGHDWEPLPYHSDEIPELYLGLAVEPADKKEITAKAAAANPNIVIFRADRDSNRRLSFKPL